jgi:hypothetical protein
MEEETGQLWLTSLDPSGGAKDTTTASVDISALSEAPRRRPRVLLGITGSVAAVKGPEIAVRLRQEANVDVKVLLTQGGHNFWTKTKDYDSHYWNQLENCSIPGTTASKVQKKEDAKGNRGDAINVHCKSMLFSRGLKIFFVSLEPWARNLMQLHPCWMTAFDDLRGGGDRC